MSYKTPVASIIILYLIVLSIIISFQGRKYDILKRKLENKYNGNHFGGFFGGTFSISIPHIIKDNSNKPELQRTVKKYNQLTRIFWLSIVIGIPVIFWVYN